MKRIIFKLIIKKICCLKYNIYYLHFLFLLFILGYEILTFDFIILQLYTTLTFSEAFWWLNHSLRIMINILYYSDSMLHKSTSSIANNELDSHHLNKTIAGCFRDTHKPLQYDFLWQNFDSNRHRLRRNTHRHKILMSDKNCLPWTQLW